MKINQKEKWANLAGKYEERYEQERLKNVKKNAKLDIVENEIIGYISWLEKEDDIAPFRGETLRKLVKIRLGWAREI